LAPSITRPQIVTCVPAEAPPVKSVVSNQEKPMLKKGPTVCEGVVRPLI
jgi:hypothetical protein